MNTASPNKLFGIVTNTVESPVSGNSGPHVFGAIFDLDAHGVVTDFTPVDFDGKNVREWKTDRFGSTRQIADHFVRAQSVLLFPIREKSADLLVEAMGDLKNEIKRGRNPFYHAASLARRPSMERVGSPPVDYTGKAVNDAGIDQTSHMMSSFARPRAATNCCQFLLDTLVHVAGVPVDALAVGKSKLPRGTETKRMHEHIMRLIGDHEVPFSKRTQMRLLDLDDQKKAFALDCRGSGLIQAINSVPKQQAENGEMLPVTTLLTEHSQPFYDAQLNSHDLGRRSGHEGR